MTEQKRIAEDATFQIACAMEYINSLRGLLHVVQDRLEQNPFNKHYCTMVDLALYIADDWHNQLDCERESLEARTSEAFDLKSTATQNAETGNVSRTAGDAQ